MSKRKQHRQVDCWEPYIDSNRYDHGLESFTIKDVQKDNVALDLSGNLPEDSICGITSDILSNEDFLSGDNIENEEESDSEEFFNDLKNYTATHKDLFDDSDSYVEEDEEELQLPDIKTSKDIFSDDDFLDIIEDELSNDSDDDMSMGLSAEYVENDDDDEEEEELQLPQTKTGKDLFEYEDEIALKTSMREFVEESATPVLSHMEFTAKLSPEKVSQEQHQVRKDNSKRLTLQDMQSAIVSKVPLITHNGGLYYYNGRTYKAISNSYELLGLVRSHISLTAFSSSTTSQFVDLLIYLKADPNLVPANYEVRLNQSKHLVVLRNGVLDLRTLKLLHHSPKYLTFHEFDAEFVDRKPNVFLRFIRDVGRGDPEIALRLSESVGFLLSGMNCRYFFVAGTAQCSGKSTLGLLLQHLIGEEQVSSLSTHQLDSRFSLGGTRNKILNLAMDVPKGHLSAVTVSLLKTISGGDPINIEEKYQPTERIVSRLRFLFGTNYKISVPQSEDEDAFWDRMVILPFQFSAQNINYSLLDELISEKDEIVSYCLRAMSRVLANNCRFSECQVADEMKVEWRNSVVDMKSFENFWYENIDVTGDLGDEILALDMYKQYELYCEENNYEIAPYNNTVKWISKNVPKSECSHKRIHKTNENPRSGYVGIRFINNN